MALRSVVTVDVDDSSFRRFSDIFAKYQKMVNDTPAAWRKVGTEVDGVLDKTATGAEKAGVSFRQTFVAISASAAALGKVTNGTEVAGRHASVQARAWGAMTKNASSFASHIRDATRSLLSWGKLTGLITGILGGGGLFGIARLATSAAEQRKSSTGLGVSAGQQKAFSLAYSRIVDNPEGLLQAVSTAQLNPQKSRPLYAVGLSEGDIQGKDAAKLSSDYIDALKRIVDQTDRRQLGSLIQPYGLAETGFDEQGLQRLKDRSPEELADYKKQFADNSGDLNLDKDQLTAWDSFKNQLSTAAAVIENTFIKGLTPLAPALGKLSESFTKLVEALLAHPKVKEWIDGLASALEGFAKYVGTDEFKEKVNTFVTDVGKLATAIGDAFTAVVDWVKWFRGGSDSTSDPSSATTGRGDLSNPDDARVPGSPAWRALRDKQRGGSDSDRPAGQRRDENGVILPEQGGIDWFRNLFSRSASQPLTPEQRAALYPSLERANGLPQGLLSSVEKQESGFKDVKSKAGAEGYFQFIPLTAQKYGVDVHNEGSSAWGAAHYYKDLLNRYHGDVSKALAGYNAGEGRVDQAIKESEKSSRDWKTYLPDETKNYVASITRNMQAQASANGGNRSVQINITNATGGNAVVSASQLAM
jgi:hypothetical protein